jgi:small basic protein (TIGR04137 family)
MSLHRSLKTKPAGLNRHRNVLTRHERIALLAEKGGFQDGDSPFGLIKVGSRKVVTKKKKKDEEGGDELADGTESASSDS